MLLQQGKGADAGATFGGGGNTVFGAAGADNFLTKFTTVVACFFMLSSVVLGLQGRSGSASSGNIFKGVAQQAPVAPAGPTTDNQEIQKEVAAEIEKAKAAKKASAGEMATKKVTVGGDSMNKAATTTQSASSSKIITQVKDAVEAKKNMTSAAAKTVTAEATKMKNVASETVKKVVTPVTEGKIPQ